MSDLSLLSSPADLPWLGLNRLPMWLGDREWAQLAPTLPQRLQQATEPVVPDAAVALAWSLRQRDGEACDRLLQACAPLLDTDDPLPAADHALRQRWRLTRLSRDILQGAHASALRWSAAVEAGAGGATLEDLDLSLMMAVYLWGCGELAEAARHLARADQLRSLLHTDGLRQRYGALLAELVQPGGADALDRLQVHTRSDEPVIRGFALRHLAQLAQARGDLAQALQWQEHAGDLLEQAGDLSGGAWVRCETVTLYARLGDHAHALELALGTAEWLRQRGWRFHTGYALSRMAEVYAALGQHDRALQGFVAAHALLADAPQQWLACEAGLGQACALHALGRLDEALGVLRRAQAGADTLRQPVIRQRTLLRTAWVLSDLGDGPAAHQLLAALPEQLADPRIDEEFIEVAAMVQLDHPGLPNWPRLRGRDPLASLLAQDSGLADVAREEARVRCLDRLCSSLHAQGRLDEALVASQQARLWLQRQHGRSVNGEVTAIEVRLGLRRARDALEQAQRATEEAERRALGLEDLQATLRVISEVGRELTSHRGMTQLLPLVKRRLKSLMPVDACLVFELTPQRQLSLLAGVAEGRALQLPDIPLDDPHALTARCARSRQTLVGPPADWSGQRLPDTALRRSMVFLPLWQDDALIGVFSVQSVLANAYGPREQGLLHTLAGYVAIAVDNAHAWREQQRTLEALREAQAALERASLTDPLTGLWNRRFIEPRIDAAARRLAAAPAGGDPPLSLLMLDLDHFKRINDEHGHAVGDQALRAVAQALQAELRPADLAARWGGEEFIVAAFDTDLAGATRLAERIRLAVAALQLPAGPGAPLRMSCSVGVAAFPTWPARPTAQPWKHALALADRALYAAKAAQRNAVWCALPGAMPQADALHRPASELLSQGHVTLLPARS